MDRKKGHLGGVGWVVIIVVSNSPNYIILYIKLSALFDITTHFYTLHCTNITTHRPKSEQQNLSMASVTTQFLGSEQGCGPQLTLSLVSALVRVLL